MTWGDRPRKRRPAPLGGGGTAASDSSTPWGRTARARELRTNATPAEIRLWQALRRKQIAGLRFRRQFPLGPYIADFVCLKAKLIVELDGSQHFTDEQQAYDARRTAWLEREGFRVLRYDNGSLSRSFDGVIRQIWDVTTSRFVALSGSPPPISGA